MKFCNSPKEWCFSNAWLSVHEDGVELCLRHGDLMNRGKHIYFKGT